MMRRRFPNRRLDTHVFKFLDRNDPNSLLERPVAARQRSKSTPLIPIGTTLWGSRALFDGPSERRAMGIFQAAE